MSNKRPFPYPGSKSLLSEWIVEHQADHETFVEVFGGGAAVLFAKPQSEKEVYNDIDNDLVSFFRALRNSPDELREWLDNCPFSREQHETWGEQYYETDERPDDNVERAGRFFFLRYSQWMGQHGSLTEFHHFGGEKAEIFENAVEALDVFADRFDGVVVENLDYRELIDEYDSEDTLFYFDPLLLDGSTDDKFSSGEWDPDAFISTVNEIEGMWQVSHLKEEIPEVWENDDDCYTVERDYKQYRECITMNYSPRDTVTICEANAEGGDALQW